MPDDDRPRTLGYDDPAGHGWLYRLRSYRQHPNGRTPAEDFLTTAFAWVLNDYPDLRQRVLPKLFDNEHDFSSAQIMTQQVNDVGDRPDLRVESGAFLGLIECKVARSLTA